MPRLLGDRVLRVVTRLVLVGCASALVGSSLLVAVPPLRHLVYPPSPASGYAVGELVDVRLDILAPVGNTVIIFARASCAASQAAKPALAAVVSRIAETTKVLLVTTRAEPEGGLQFAADVGLAESSVLIVDFADLRVRHVPSILVVGAGGIVQFAEVGVPDSVQAYSDAVISSFQAR